MNILSHGCTLDCADCCKFNVHVENNEVIKIKGDKSHPYTKGFICKKGMAHLERLNHKDRIYTPLLKVNGVWKEISFEGAINLMKQKLSYYKENFSSHSIFYHEQYGSGSLLKSCGNIFFNFFGGVTQAKGGPCWSAGIKAQKYDFGDVKSHSLEDMLNSKTIIVWGKNPANTTIHTMQMLKKAKDNGVTIVVIDPIATTTSKFADKYIRITPGTDGALAFAMAKIIIEENLHDVNFINSYVLGFNQYKEYLDTLDINSLCAECNVSIKEVTDLVKLYTKKYSTIYLGYGIQKYHNGGNTIRAIDALGAITGQIGYSGGGVNYANMVYPNILNTDPYHSSSHGITREFYLSEISNFLNNSTTINPNNSYSIPIKMAVITKSNLLNQLPDLNKLEDAFSKIEFKVCFDLFMTNTAEQCDLFIPCTNTLESEDLLYSSMCNPYLIYNEKVLEPQHKLMDEYYFFMELAKALNMKDYPNVSKKEYIEEVIKPLKKYDTDINLTKIKNEAFTIHQPIPWIDKEFKTASKKFELYSENAREDGLTPIPTYFNNTRNDDTYKFRLLTNHGRDTLSSQHYIDKDGLSQFYINSTMSSLLGLENKQVVLLKSPNGSIKSQLNIDDAVGDYIVEMFVCWWKKHGNPNFITCSENSDMGGQITYNETFINIVI